MSPWTLVRSGALLAAAFLASVALAAGKPSPDEAMSHDGLQRISVKGIELAYARPGVTLAGYQKVMLDPVGVSFRKDWNPTRAGSHLKLSADERESIRTGVAKIVHEEFVRELQRGGGYQVVADAGTDVLRVRPYIADLYVTALGAGSVGSSRSYVVTAGEMTLVAELLDSETGQVLARVIDRREARRAGQMMRADSFTNANEARDIAAAWARILRNGLDRAHGIGRK